MRDEARKRILKTYRQTAKVYDSLVSERLGNSRWGIESLTGLLLRDMRFNDDPVVLDLACGTGLSTFKLIESLGGEGSFHGLDLSPDMIKQAKQNQKTLGYTVDFRVGDSNSLPYEDDSFDAVISNMSFQMFPEKKQALEEVYRVLRPDGELGLLFGGGNHLEELISLCTLYGEEHQELTGFNQAIEDTKWMHIDIEETQRLLWETGFRRPNIFGYHRVMHVNPRIFWLSNPYPVMWRTQLPVGQRGQLDEEIIALMEKSVGRGFKLTWYTLQAYGSKPSQ